MLDFLHPLGGYKTADNNDFACTTAMIDSVIEAIKLEIPKLTNFQKSDLGISLMIMTDAIPPVLELVNLCFENMDEEDFKRSYNHLAEETDYFELYSNYKIRFIDEDQFCIEIIAKYLRGIARKDENIEKLFKAKFKEITKKIQSEMYDKESTCVATVEVHSTLEPWSEICLTTCNTQDRFGPNLAKLGKMCVDIRLRMVQK